MYSPALVVTFHPDRALAAPVIAVLLPAGAGMASVECQHFSPSIGEIIVHLSYAET